MSRSDWEHLEKYKQGIIDGDVIADIWQAEDVLSRSTDMEEDPKLTEDEVRDVLSLCYHKMDACYGINWDVIDSHICTVIQDRVK